MDENQDSEAKNNEQIIEQEKITEKLDNQYENGVQIIEDIENEYYSINEYSNNGEIFLDYYANGLIEEAIEINSQINSENEVQVIEDTEDGFYSLNENSQNEYSLNEYSINGEVFLNNYAGGLLEEAIELIQPINSNVTNLDNQDENGVQVLEQQANLNGIYNALNLNQIANNEQYFQQLNEQLLEEDVEEEVEEEVEENVEESFEEDIEQGGEQGDEQNIEHDFELVVDEEHALNNLEDIQDAFMINENMNNEIIPLLFDGNILDEERHNNYINFEIPKQSHNTQITQ